jgi:hypothetical protein
MRLRPPNYFILLLSLLVFGCASQQLNAPAAQDNEVIVKPHCYHEAAKEFLRWDKSNGKELLGLSRRRQEEMNLFLKDCH